MYVYSILFYNKYVDLKNNNKKDIYLYIRINKNKKSLLCILFFYLY